MNEAASGDLPLTNALMVAIAAKEWRIRTLLLASAGLSGVLFAVAILMSPTMQGLGLGLGLVLLILCGTIDILTFRIPNALTYSGTVIVLITAASLGGAELTRSLLGGLVGLGFLGVLSVVSRGSVGMGDAKLGLLGGTLVGADYVVHALFFSTMAAALFCVPALASGRLSRRQPIPYGPFLSAGFTAVALATGSILF